MIDKYIVCMFAPGNARVAQLVERQPSKLNVAGSNPVSRSKSFIEIWSFFVSHTFLKKLEFKGFNYTDVRLLIYSD